MTNFIYNENGLDVQKMRDNSALAQRLKLNGTLPHEAFEKWDDEITTVVRKKLNVLGDLASYGLVDNNYNLGDVVASYEKISNFSAANVSLDGVTQGDRDRVLFEETGVPIPIFHKGFQILERQLQASRNKGKALDTIQLVEATESVALAVDNMIWNGSAIKADGKSLFGFTNHPNRITTTAAAAWGGGGDDPVGDIEAALAAAYTKNYFGPFVLYVSQDNWAFLQGDYSANKGDRTFLERFEAFSNIDSVKLGSQLDNGECVLVQMDRKNLELKVAQDFVSFEEPQTNLMQHDFRVMSAMALCLKADYDDNLGVVHISGC